MEVIHDRTGIADGHRDDGARPGCTSNEFAEMTARTPMEAPRVYTGVAASNSRSSCLCRAPVMKAACRDLSEEVLAGRRYGQRAAGGVGDEQLPIV